MFKSDTASTTSAAQAGHAAPATTTGTLRKREGGSGPGTRTDEEST
ncbi:MULTISPECIES: hypothetical protein [unclassified Streptomyces]